MHGPGAFGLGLNENVCEAYIWLCLNWIPGDEIFIFGFSRGAFTARAISGLIAELGLIKRSKLGKFHSAYDAYTKRAEKGGKEEWDSVKLKFDNRNAGRRAVDVKIKVVGVSLSFFGPGWGPLTIGYRRRFGTL